MLFWSPLRLATKQQNFSNTPECTILQYKYCIYHLWFIVLENRIHLSRGGDSHCAYTYPLQRHAVYVLVRICTHYAHVDVILLISHDMFVNCIKSDEPPDVTDYTRG